MRARSCVFDLIALAGFFVEVYSSAYSNPSFVWKSRKPLIFSENETSNSFEDLKGILPEIWPSIVEQCRSNLSVDDLKIVKHGAEIEAPELTISERMHGKSILLPFKRRKEKKSCLGMHFVKLIDSPGVAVLIRKTVTGTDLLNSILLAWPILIFVILSASLSGFIIWFLEYRANPQMFDPFCPWGVLNGFWWAAVTMTTVGYGDLTPKTVLGRLFTTLWISAGLVILAMYMGVVTTSLATTRLEGTQHFYGLTVSVVKQSEEERFAILQNTDIHVEDDELAVIDAVNTGKEGVRLGFIDFYVASYFSELISKKNLHIVRIMPRDRAHGVLMGKDWDPEVVECFRRVSEDNRHVIHQVIPKYIRRSEHKSGLMDYFSGSVFGYSIFALAGLLSVLILLGLCFDRRHFELKQKD